MSRVKSREAGVREVPAEILARPSAEDELRRWAERAARNWRFRQSLLPQPRTQPGQIELALERIRVTAERHRLASMSMPMPGAYRPPAPAPRVLCDEKNEGLSIHELMEKM